ncbi:MAG: hypothetical protein Q9202_002614 [Teloschistes flavicans]
MSINKGNVFSSKNLCEYMLSSLPKGVSPELRDPYDAVALLSHACMLAVGFRLEGLGEDHKTEEASSDPSEPQPLPPQWNITTTFNYAFRYAHTQSSLHYILKVSRLGSKAIINGLAIVSDADEKVHSLEIAIKDFLSPSNFPFSLSSIQNDTSTADPGHGDEDQVQANANKLSACFISAGRIADLGGMLKFQIIQKLAPSLHKEGYEESAHAASHASSTTPSEPTSRQPPPERGDPRPAYDPLRDDPTLPPYAQPHPFNDPLAEGPPRRPYPAGDFPPPGFEDEYEINRPPHHMPGGLGGGRRPLNIGERDLYPPGMGPHDPLRGPGGGFGGIGGGAMGGGGMHPTFDDPLFRGEGGGGGVGGYGGRAPPGARYDPVGPGDGPPNLRGGGRFPDGGAGGMGGRPPNPFGGFGGGDFI